MRTDVVRLCELVVAVVFLLSATGKMVNAGGFGELISSYGLPWLSVLAPLIVLAELLAGLCLLLQISTRLFALLSLLMLLVFTGAFLYGNVFHGIEDCGCFGDIGRELPSWLTYLRNAVLMLLCCIVIKFGTNKGVSPWQWGLIGVLMVGGAFWTGNSWHLSSFYANQFARPHELLNLQVKETPLAPYLHASNDSTYVVWVFSHSCGTCVNGIENIKKYRQGVADRLVTLCVTEPTERKNRLLDIDFESEYVGDALQGFIKVLPTLLYIEKGQIHYVIEGTVPNVYLFKKNYLEKTNDEILNEIKTQIINN